MALSIPAPMASTRNARLTNLRAGGLNAVRLSITGHMGAGIPNKDGHSLKVEAFI